VRETFATRAKVLRKSPRRPDVLTGGPQAAREAAPKSPEILSFLQKYMAGRGSPRPATGAISWGKIAVSAYRPARFGDIAAEGCVFAGRRRDAATSETYHFWRVFRITVV